MKKFISLALALVAMTTMAFAGTDVTVDCGKQVQISATPATGWHFVEWNDHNTENPRTLDPSADTHYVASFAINQYTVIFQNWDGTELQNETLNHGDAVSYKGATPTKPATTQYSYTFSGWSPNISTPATGDATYTAQFDQTVNKYTITFKNYDGTTLQSSDWDYGQTPTYNGATPTKPADAEFTYAFTGWDKTINIVTGEEEYIAQFSNTTNSYTITVNGENGTTTGGGTFLYGTNITITATPAECYEFVRWSDGDTNASRTVTVMGNTTYTAVFTKIQYTITTASDDAVHGTTSAIEL